MLLAVEEVGPIAHDGLLTLELCDKTIRVQGILHLSLLKLRDTIDEKLLHLHSLNDSLLRRSLIHVLPYSVLLLLVFG